MPKVEAIVTMARCSKSGGLFGVRFQKDGDTWYATWAFKVDERKAHSEGYESASFRGKAMLDSTKYPGCPYCGNVSLKSENGAVAWSCTDTYGTDSNHQFQFSGGAF